MQHSIISKSVTSACLIALLSTSAFASQLDVQQALKAGNLDSAVTAYKTLTTAESSNLEGQLLWARILLAQDETEDAYDLMEGLLEKNTENVDLQYRFGQSAMVMAQKASIFSKLGYAKDGLKAWTTTLSIDPNHQPALEGLVGFHRMAPGMAGGDIDKALEYAQTLKKIDPLVGIASLVGVYQTMEKDDLAIKELDAGIVAYPDSSRLFFLRGMKALKDKKWAASYQDLNAALLVAIEDNEKTNVLYQLGKLAVKSGENIKPAIDSLTTLMTMSDHRYPQWGNLRLAQLYTTQGDFAKAKATLALIDDNDDDDLEDEVKKLKKQLRKLVKKR
jgi:tetratricopeptide (TPR) repeat protein